MKEDLFALLVCPNCRRALDLRNPVKEGDDIVGGELECGGCGNVYLIANGVPDLRIDGTESGDSNR